MKLLTILAAATVLLGSTAAFAWNPCSVVIFADKTDVCVGQTVNVQTVSFNCDVPVTNSFPVVSDVPGTVTITQQCTACNGDPSSSLLDIYFSAITNVSPSTATMCLGSSMDFSALASPTNVSCEPVWSVDPENAGTLTVDGLTATFTLLNGTAGSTVTLYAYCGITTNSALITVTTNNPLTITSQPVSQVVCTGNVVTFSVSATGDSLTYQWRNSGVDLVDGGSISGATSSTLTISNIGPMTSLCQPVPATSGGSTFSNVIAGVSYFYDAWGCATFDLDGNYTDPNGLIYTNHCADYTGGPQTANSGFLCPGLISFSLVGQINGSSCFQLGESGVFVPTTSGTLILYYNDDIYGDNSGSWTACVSTVDGEYDVVVSSSCGYQISSQARMSLSTLCDGIPDWWRAQYFGGDGTMTNSQSCALCDPDGDGVDNLQEFENGTDPTNYYNNVLPGLAIVSGNGQTGLTNMFLPEALLVSVTNTNGAPFTNAPVTFAVTVGTGQLAGSTNATTVSSLSVHTDTNGNAAVYFLLPGTFDTTNQITVTATSDAGTTQVVFNAMTYSALDSDGDGIPDWWDNLYGLNPYSGISLGGTNLNLVGWWKLDEATGTNVLNSAPGVSGGNGGAIDIDATNDHVSGVFSNALYFNGTNAYVQIVETPAFTPPSNDFSVSLWVNLAPAPNQEPQPLIARGDSDSLSFSVIANNLASYGTALYTLQFDVSNNGGIDNSRSLRSVTPLKRGQWYQVGLTYHFVSDGTSILDLYIDGRLDSSNSIARGPLYNASDSGIYLGRRPNDTVPGGPYMQGAVDDVRYYTRALNQDEITDLHQAFEDPDNDGLVNLQEYLHGTDPHNFSTAGDGIPDGWAVYYGFNPLDPTIAGQDPDSDGLTNYQEYLAGTDPLSVDTDLDGMPDAWEIAHGLNPTSGISLGGTNEQMVGWWKLDEATGTNVLNSAPGVAGTNILISAPGAILGNGVAIGIDATNDHVSGVFSNALQFNGTNAYVVIPYSPAFVTTNGDFSVSFWMNRDASDNSTQRLFTRGTYPNWAFWLEADQYDANAPGSLLYVVTFVVDLNGSGGEFTTTRLVGTIPMQTSVWYQVAASYHYVSNGSSIMNLYINGVLAGSTQSAFGPPVVSDRPITFGLNDIFGGIGNLFKGRLDDVRYNTYYLSVDELANAFQDPDHNGLTNLQDYQDGADPHNPDINGDGIPDGVGLQIGISPTNTDDSADGISNAASIALGLNPLLPEWQSPPYNPSDHTPPTITLNQPINATLVP
ncbi:MAG TPA: LamG-like jellyroll fold domain-containing protein [Verrucomicrobiae bacterium]|nr:LamG-like jellyroll fold domain-containing protein [Verrucomicrobiae bacterium]